MRGMNPYISIAEKVIWNANIGWSEIILILRKIFHIICPQRIKGRSGKLFMITLSISKNNGTNFNGGYKDEKTSQYYKGKI